MKKVILYVEDEPSDALFMRRAWQKLGSPCVLQEARDGQEAIEYLEGSGPFSDRAANPPPDYVLLDLKMPRKTGHEVLEWLRSHPQHKGMPVIVYTSSREGQDLARTRALGIDDYIVKPVSFAALVDVARTIAARWGIPLSP